ncbi:MAG: GIY-YIG nuclease family protein [Candidatus Magasanikbacteria bacterium]|nr:GIY-YIG nuclease family protein [Candidatus Magasanikbacteria bacterium]
MKIFKQILSRLPDAPGSYLFYNLKKELIYVGKATSLKNRVRSYFVGARTPRPIEEMIHEVARVDYKETNSVLEAVILEALYIKKFLPKYNVLGKDDKSWNYLVITKDIFPRLETLRQHDFALLDEKAKRQKFAKIFGPYPGLNTMATLKILRRLFRFSTCYPPVILSATKNPSHHRKGILHSVQDDKRRKRPCLYYEMGQCLGVCTGKITAREYRAKVIRPLQLFLGGKTQAVLAYFKIQMRAASRAQNYEAAAHLRDQLKQLTRIQDITIINQSFFEPTLDDSGQSLKTKVQRPFRIEGYDISNLGASEKVGSMVVFENGESKKSDYRKFIIKSVPGQSDVDCLREVFERRLRHAPHVGNAYMRSLRRDSQRDVWPLPNLILVDGGRSQVRAVKKVLVARHLTIPLIGLAKGKERKRNDIILGPNTRPLLLWLESHRKLLIQVRDEAHRFAIKFHRARRAKFALH